MNSKETSTASQPPEKKDFKQRVRQLGVRILSLQGKPHYIAMGMAIGVFVGVTPTIPLHTVIAVALAFVLKGSKPAAIIGVWVGNPLTIPFFYLGSYKIGVLLLGKSIPFDLKYESVSELMKLGLDATLAMIAGGVVLGVVPGVAAYFITRKVFRAIRSRAAKPSPAQDAKPAVHPLRSAGAVPDTQTLEKKP